METTIETKMRAAMRKAAELFGMERKAQRSVMLSSALSHAHDADYQALRARRRGDALCADVWERQARRYRNTAHRIHAAPTEKIRIPAIRGAACTP